MIALKNIDPDDFSLPLRQVELSFGFRFGADDLTAVSTFGQLCDVIANKVHQNNSNDCTTQQAFYKLRTAIADTLQTDKDVITPNTDIVQLFPRRDRRQKIRAFNERLGFPVIKLEMSSWFVRSIFAGVALSLAGFFFNWWIALSGLAGILLLNWVANKVFANELAPMTVRQLAKKFAREHYLRARRNPATVNHAEIEQNVRELFSEALGLEEAVLTRNAAFV